MKTEKVGGITSVVMHDKENVVGLAEIKDFRGESMHIDPEYLKRAIDMADSLFEDVNDIEIGINKENPGGTFFIFLNEKKAAALVVAGRREDV